MPCAIYKLKECHKRRFSAAILVLCVFFFLKTIGFSGEGLSGIEAPVSAKIHVVCDLVSGSLNFSL